MFLLIGEIMIESRFHCGLPVSDDMIDKFKIRAGVIKQIMCCTECEAVAQVIADSGMESYYWFRTNITKTKIDLAQRILLGK